MLLKLMRIMKEYLLRVNNVTVLSQNTYQEYIVVTEQNDTAIIDNYLIQPFMEIGATYMVFGIVDYQNGAFKVNPRAQAGIIRLYDLTLQVDMQNEVVDPSGVFVNGTWNSMNMWGEPAQMTANGSIYTTTVKAFEGWTVYYKFINGNNYEIVIGECATGANGDRYFSMPDSAVTLDLVCFNKCISCDSLNSTLPLVNLEINFTNDNMCYGGSSGNVYVHYTVGDVGNITDRGLVIGSLPNLSMDGTVISDGSGPGEFDALVDNLEAGTYYLIAYAENENGIAYSAVKQIEIREPDLLNLASGVIIDSTTASYELLVSGGIPPYMYQMSLCTDDSTCILQGWQSENIFTFSGLQRFVDYQVHIEVKDDWGCQTFGNSVLTIVPDNTIQKDSLALVALYNATDGPNWTNNENWLEGPVDTWYGITVEDSTVIGIELNVNGLNGSIPAALGYLSNLLWLTLNSNQLYGNIPAELGQLSNLENFQLISNQLSGTIPSELGQLLNLQILQLYNNQLSGNIPAEFGQLSNLNSLYLGYNNLSGGIPAELCNLPLSNVYFEGNLFDSESCPTIQCLLDNGVLFAGDPKQPQQDGSHLVGDCFPKPEATILKATVNPIVGGDIDSIWAMAEPNNIDRSFRGENPTLGSPGETWWKALWADNGIYFLVNVKDDDWYPRYIAGGTDYWQYDMVELYFDVNYIKEDGLGGQNPGLSGHYQIAPVPTESNTDGSMYEDFNPGSGIQYAYILNDSSYMVEYFVPFSYLRDADDYELNITDSIGFDVTVIDNDSPGGDGDRQRAVWANMGLNDESWNNMDDAGLIYLDGAEVIPVENIVLSVNDSITEDNQALQVNAEIYPGNATKVIRWFITAMDGGPCRATISNSGVIEPLVNENVIVYAMSDDYSVISNELVIEISGQNPTPDELSYIRNGYFNLTNADLTPGEPWNGETSVVVDGVLQIANPSVGENPWDWVVSQVINIPESVKNEPFILSLTLWADEPCIFDVDFELVGDDYLRFGNTTDPRSPDGKSQWRINLTTTPTIYTFLITDFSGMDLRIQKFNLFAGLSGSTVYVDNISLYNINDLHLLPEMNPIVNTFAVVDISTNTANSGGYILYNGGLPITAKGVCWSTSPNPTINDSQTSDGTGDDDFASTITGLNDETTYYARAYATNSLGTGYGEELIFTTEKLIICNPIVFQPGWNLFSTPVILDKDSVGFNFQSLIDNGSLVKIQDEAGNAFEDLGVFGDGGWDDSQIKPIRPYDGFKIKVSKYDSIQFTGNRFTYPYPIYLNEGWNIIGYPQEMAVSAQEVIQQIIDRGTLVKVQDETGSAIEDLGVFGGWINFIGNFYPGEGYKVKVSARDTLWIYDTYAKSTVIARTKVQPVHFKPDYYGNGVDHMNLNLVDLPDQCFERRR